MVKRALMGCTISVFGRNPAWNNEKHRKLGQWLGHLSGKNVSNFGAEVTHLVVSHRRWTENPKPAVIIKALEEKAGGRDLKIVSFDWLEDCLTSQSKKREGPYEWDKRDAEQAKQSVKAQKAAEKAEKGAAKSVPGMLSEVFHESTEQYVDPLQKEKLDRQLERERELRVKNEKEEKEQRLKRRQEQARIFGRGAKKARNRLLSDTHHLYTDSTGFKYDVLVTKIDVRANRNERHALTIQIYESNEEPHTYATDTRFSGMNITPANTLVSATGTNYYTAMHAFKSEFKDHTAVEWDERISAHIKRLRQDKLERGVGTGSAAGASVRGAPVSESAVLDQSSFAKRKFEYHPPGYGPKGEVSNEEKARLKDLGVTVTEGPTSKARAPAVVLREESIEPSTREVVEEWMRGADMSVAEPSLPVQVGEVEQEVDFDAMMKEATAGTGTFLGEEYPFEKALDDAVDQHHGAGAAQQIEDGVFQASAAGEFNGGGEQNANGPVTGGENSMDGLEHLDFSGGADDSWMYEDAPPDQNSGVQPGQDDSFVATQHDSLQPEVPSFTTHPTTDSMFFQHGTQDIGETQVAEKAGGEFLEDFVQNIPKSPVDEQQPTPPSSAKKGPADMETASTGSKGSSGGSKVLGGLKGLGGGLNLGSSILGKRKIAAAEGGEGAKKAARVAVPEGA